MAKKDTQSSRGPTRRQIALSRREQEKLRLIYMGLGLVAVLILIVLGFGLLQTYVFEPNAPVAVVNGEEISTGQYRSRVKYERFILEDQLQQISQQLASLPPQEEDDQFSQLLRNQYQQFANQLTQQRVAVDRQTLDVLIAEELIQAEANRRDITVSEDEVTEAINRFLARRQGGLTQAAARETSTARAQATATAALWTPTPTFTPSPTLTTTQEITPTATPANSPTPAPTPTFNIIATDTLSTEYNNWLATLQNQADISEAQYREIMRRTVLRNKLNDQLAEELPRVAEQAHARHILVETEEEANQVLERLEAGEDFAALAEELSTDTGSAANGGDLGFVPQGSFVPAIDEAVFNLPIGQVSEPIETQFGWHIVEVLEREERELSPSDYSQLQNSALSNWISEAREEAEIEEFWTPEKAPEDDFLEGRGF